MNKHFLVISLMIFNIAFITAQGKFGKVTPQVSDFMKYGDVQVSLFSGKLDLEVPIYNYKDYDFEIPIKLVYGADGFKPSKRADFVGLDWTLIAGGCITREIYGAPDDYKSYSSGIENGYFLTVKDGGFDKNKIWNFDPTVVHTSTTNTNDENAFYYLHNDIGYVDFQPDLFMFNFNGHGGQFMIDADGTAKSMNRSYKIDITDLKPQAPEYNGVDGMSAITITTPEGYKYVFGGQHSKLEYTFNFIDAHVPEQPYPTIVAWHLSHIIAPNGRIATFNYVSHADYMFNKYTDPLWQSTETEVLKDELGMPLTPLKKSGVATKKSVLESIVIDNTIIEFQKSVESTLINYNNRFHGHTNYNCPIYQLDAINVKVNNINRYSYLLSYENQSKRRFLQSVLLADNQKYTFNYNHTQYPNPELTSDPNVDFYGYWTKNNTASSYGLLNRITYPTGGYSEFVYEKHQFSNEVIFDASIMNKYISAYSNSYLDSMKVLDFEPAVDGDEDLLPIERYRYVYFTKYRHNGARIKLIKSFNTDNIEASSKKYIYNNNINSEISSGILYQSPPIIGTHIPSGNRIYAGGSIWQKNYNIDESAIGYSTVHEIQSDSSYIKYIFTDWHDIPDLSLNVKFKFITYGYQPTEYDAKFLTITGHSRIASSADRRGRLKQKQTYNNNGELMNEKFLYRGVSFSPTTDNYSFDYVISFLSMKGGGMAKKIYLDKYHPQIYYSKDESNVFTKQETEYNEFDLPKISTTQASNGDFIRTEYFYPFNYPDEPYKIMADTNINIISPVIEEVTSRIKNNVATVIQRTKTEYISLNNLFLPSKTFTAIGVTPLRQINSFDKYDGKGKPLQETGKDGVPISYVWSYNNQYPIAEIKNATYQAVQNVAGLSDIISYTEPTDYIIQSFSQTLKSALPNALVTTYTYKPLVGMTSSTDPRGVTTYYEYDSFNRLNETYIIENGVKKVLKKFDYHYANQ